MTAAAPAARLAVLQLRGTEAEMGHQHGSLVASLGGRDALAGFYPTMAARMLTLRTPHDARARVRGLIQPLLDRSARRLDAARRARFPELVARSEAGIRAAGLPPALVRWLTVMDVFQNTIGRLGALRLPALTGLQLQGVPMCSSLAVWGRASATGQLLHARNFDFPGIGLWDARPAVAFCTPDRGLRYGFVTSLGVDLPGITGFNEAGLTITAHTRLHARIDPDGTAIADLGHAIIREARSLDEAVALARRLGAASTWGLLVSSAAEQDAVLIETHGGATRVVRPGEGAAHLACTNRYQHPELARGEIHTSPGFAIDSDARFATLEAAGRRGGLDPAALQALLASTCDPTVPDADNDPADRITGNCISSPLTVQSVVVMPEAGAVQVAAGRAPTARGPWTTVPFAWGEAVGVVEHSVPLPAETDALAPARAAYVEAARLDLEGGTAAALRGQLAAAASAAPREPHLQFLGALAALGARDLPTAQERLHRGLAVETAPYRRAQLLRWAARVEAAQGSRGAARALRAEALQLGPGAAALRPALRRDARWPAGPRQLARVVPDVMLVDG